MVDNTDDIFEGKETVTTISGGIGPGGVTRTETTTTKDEVSFEEGQDLDLDMSTTAPAEELDKKEKDVEVELQTARADATAVNVITIPEEFQEKKSKEKLEEDKANQVGNLYADYKDVFASVSAEINKKTIQLLATKHMDHLDLSDDGVVTNKQGEVVETKEDFIKATGFDTGDIIYDNASKQFDSEELSSIKFELEKANDAWLYLKSSLEYESGNNFFSLMGMGEEQKLDFKQFEEQMKIEVLNQLTIDQLEKAAQEGNIMKKGVTGYDEKTYKIFGQDVNFNPGLLKYGSQSTFNRYFKERASTSISLQDKEMILTNAKGVVLGNQLKIQVAAGQKLVVLRDNLNDEKSKLEDDINNYKNLAERTQDDITKLNKKYGAYTYNKKGDIYFESYGILPTPEDAAEQERINVALKKLGVDKLTLGKERAEVLELQETYNDGVKDYTASNEELFNTFLYDDVNEKFSAFNFKQSVHNLAYKELLRNTDPYMGPILDIMSTAADGIGKYVAANAVFKALANPIVLAGAAVVGAIDYNTDLFQQGLVYNRKEIKGYGKKEGKIMPFTSDMMNTLLDIAGDRFLPVSDDPMGNMTVKGFKSEKDNWLGRQYDYMLGEGSNWNLYSGTKTVADLMGYVGALRYGIGNLTAKHALRTKKLKMAQVVSSQGSYKHKLGASIAHSLSKGFVGTKSFTASLEMVKVTQRMLTLDNIADGKARGLNDFQAFAYGNFLSFATGVSQSIMPDYKWFSTPGGRKIKDALIGKLTGEAVDKIATRNAVRVATRQFGINFFKEQLEEQADLALSDVVKGMYIAGHSPDILKAEVQAEVLRGTTLLTGTLGSIQSRRTYKTVRSMTNIAMTERGYEILKQGNGQLKILEEELEKVEKKTTVKDKEYKKLLQQDIAALKQNISDGKDRLRAINAAPDQVTDEQIDLLIQKNKLIDDRSKLNKKDKALVAGDLELINNQIAELDAKIQEATPVKYSESVMKAMLENVKRLAGKYDIAFISLDESNYDKEVEKEIKYRHEFNKKIDNEINQLDGSTPEGRKKMTQLESRKLIIPTFKDPGIISYDPITKKHRIVINEMEAKKSQNEGVALHELFHAVLFQTVKNSPNKVKGLSYMMKQEMLKNPDKYSYILGKFDKYSYTEDINTMSFDELFTVFSEALIQGDIKIESTIGSKISDFIRRSLREININFTVSGPNGMINFIRDYNSEVMNGRKNFSRGMKRIMDDGLKINVSKEYIQKAELLEKTMIYAGKSRENARALGLERTFDEEDGPLIPQVTEMFGREGEVKSDKTTYTTKNDNGETVTITVKTLADGSREVSYFIGEAKFENRYQTEKFKKDNTLTDEEIIKNVVAGEGEAINKESEVKKPKTQATSRSIKTKATTTSVYDQKKLVSDLKLKDSTAKIVEENAKIRELMLEEGIKGKKGKIVASEDLQTRLVENNLALAVSLGTFAAQNPNILGLEVSKRVNAQQFISGYYMELSKLARTYDASVNEFGQYLNTILPLRYGDILAAEKAGAIEGSIGLDAAKEIESDIDENLTPDEVIVGPEVDTAERFGIKEETKPFVDKLLKKVKKLESLRVKIAEDFDGKTAKEIAILESQGVNDLELSTITVKQAPNLLYKFTSKLFGIDQDKLNPKSEKWLANLRKNDKRGTNEVRAAQRAVVQNAQLILSTIFNEGHTKAHKSSGMPNSLLKFGYNKSSKKIKNSWPQYKKPNLSEKDLLEFVGIYRVKGKYEFKVDRNTGTKLLAIASMVDRNMSLQAINENLKETGDITAQVRVALEDGMSKSSKSIFYRQNPKYQPLIQDKLHSIAAKINVADVSDINAINKIIADEFADTKMGRKNGLEFAKELTRKGGIIARYAERVDRAGPMEKDFDVFLSEQLEEVALLEGLLEKLKINVKKNADLYTVKTMQNARSRVGQFVTDVLLDEYNNSEKTDADKKILYEQIFMLMQQHVTAAKAGDGSVWFVDGTNEVEDAYYPEDKVYTKDKGENKKGDKHPLAGKKIEKGGTLRYQLFGSEQGSSVDFAKFMNTFLEGTGIKIGLTSAENKAIKDEYKIKALAPQKSSSVINSLIKKTFSYIDRYNEAMLARELTKKQVLFYAENKMIPKNELAVHMMTFGSNMGTVSRRAAYVYGIQEGLLSNGISGSYVYSKISEIGKKLEFEHGKPHLATIMDLLKIGLSKKSAENKNTAMDEVFVDYEVNIITKKMDATLTASGVKSSMYLNYVLGKAQGWAQRLYNELNFGHPDVGAILSLSGDGKTIGGAHSRITKSKILPKSAKSIKFDQKINKGIKAARSIKYTNNPKGITVLDFDDTLATTKSGVRAKIPNPDGLPKPGRKVIFLAGGAGSGKSNVIGKLGLKDQGFKVVNSDISLEWLKKNSGLPENMNDLTKEQRSKLGSLQHQARGIAKRKMIKFQGKGDGVVIDGTGGSINSMEKLVKEFKDKGYDVSMLFVETSLPVALERNTARKERSLLDKIVEKNHEAVQGNKNGFKAMFGGRFMEVNTDNLSQQDAMPTELTEQMNNFVSSYENRRLDAEEFASEGADILDQGGTFDFSEFNKVVEGETAPLFNKAMKLQDKFGNKDMFVLTARPAESAPAIFEFLKANGLNIPLGNITGLANSTSEAKALWMAEKVGEGYNDFYFADDALQNVQAVQNMLDQFDVKSKVQQAKASRSIKYNQQFNEILEETTGVESEKRFSRAKAKMRGEDKGKYKIFIPPSADDFIGMLYSFLGKGKKGEADFKFFKEALIEPLNRAYIELNMARQSIANDYKKLTKAFPEIRKMLYDKLPGTEFTTGDAMRVYLWDKAGYNIPGLSTSDQNALVEKINEDADLKAFADTVGIISRVEEGYVRPNDEWQVEDIRVDLMNSMQKVHRKVFFQQFLENKNIIFSKENLNKIEAIYGSNFREALEDMLYRIENGTNRSFGSNRLVNRFMNFINGSIGTTMFFNSRSAVLQTLSTVNFINWKENNPLAAAKAFANQKQFWADFSMIFNSTFLKQRRAGLNIDVNASELTDFVTNSKQPVRSAVNWLLQKGFLPTQMMDSFAIAMGGASHYRNNVNRLLKDGMTLKEAEEQAFLDMQEIAEETQQSARPDKISQQQASVLGRLILAFQNTPMQYTRLIKKAILDLQAGRGDAKSHVSRIIYYGAIQNVIFYSLQTALFAMMFGDDDDEEFIDKKTERVVNGSIDSILRGMGVGGAVVSTVKNMIRTIIEQQGKSRHRKNESAVLMEFLNLSPPIGIKARQIQNASKTLNWNEDKIKNTPLYNLDNPVWEAGFNYTQAFTNVPLARLHTKVNNLREAANNDNQAWQRIALFLGWSKWNLGIKDKKSKSKKKTKKRKRGAFGGLKTAG